MDERLLELRELMILRIHAEVDPHDCEAIEIIDTGKLADQQRCAPRAR